MNKIDKIKIDKLIHSLGLKYNLSDSIIKEIIELPDLVAYEKIKQLNLSEVETEEALKELNTNFNYPGLGKLYIDFRIVHRRNKQRNNINNINSKKWKK